MSSQSPRRSTEFVAVKAGPEGFGYRLRPVERTDAAEILRLRTDPILGQFLNPTSGGVEDQEHWIEMQRARVGDHYFAIETLNGRWEGLVGLYGIEETSGEWGRWILRRGSLAAPASVLLVLRFGFDELGLRRIYCRTLAHNAMGVSFQDSCAYTSRSEYIDPAGRIFVEHSLVLSDWPSFRDALGPTAERVARRSARL
jgi:RimJ/RimL family protein N-acetyltransferase